MLEDGGSQSLRIKEFGKVHTAFNEELHVNLKDWPVDFLLQMCYIEDLFNVKKYIKTAAYCSLFKSEMIVQLPANKNLIEFLVDCCLNKILKRKNISFISSKTKKYSLSKKFKYEKNETKKYRCEQCNSDIINVDFDCICYYEDANQYKKKYWSNIASPSRCMFRRKIDLMSGLKTNVYFDTLWQSFLEYDRVSAEWFYNNYHFFSHCFDDQICATLLLSVGLCDVYKKGFEYACRLLLDYDGAKMLSNILKGLGQNACFEGAMLVECGNLRGRGATTLDKEDQSLSRCGKRGRELCEDKFDDDTLRKAIRLTLEDELDKTKLVFDEVDDFWTKRWLWSANGGHSRVLEKKRPEWEILFKGRLHRKVAMENFDKNPLIWWDGFIFVSQAEKLETDKRRMLLSCDTVSYTAFEHILRPVEKSWRNHRVILDPGRGGNYGIARRIVKLGEKKFKVMSDYDYMDMQHTTKALKMVFEELVRITGYDTLLGQRLIESWDKTYIYDGERLIGKVSATLMTGHRATTFCNSVLNAAYIRALDFDRWYKIKSVHIGDDIIALTDTPSIGIQLVRDIQNSKLKMNPSKQSMGIHCGELLRMCITKNHAIGYLCRSVASFVNGNWTTDSILGQREKLVTAITSVRSMINRSGIEAYATILSRSVHKATGFSHKYIRQLLLGTMCLGEGPMFSGGVLIKKVDVVNPIENKIKEKMYDKIKECKSYATNDYLSFHTSEVEQIALQYAQVSIQETMMLSSYTKDVSSGIETNTAELMFLKLMKPEIPRGCLFADELYEKDVWLGALGKYPLIHMIKDLLNKHQVSKLLDIVGRFGFKDDNIAAWGAEANAIRIMGVIPFNDAASFCKKTKIGIVYVNYNVYM